MQKLTRLALLVGLVAPSAAQLAATSREVSVLAQTYHQGTDLSQTVGDADSTAIDGPFQVDFALTAVAFFNGVQALAGQDSDVDAATGSFEGTGYAGSSLYVQGTGDATASSELLATFETNGAARLRLETLVLAVDDQFGGQFAFDGPAEARAFAELSDLGTGTSIWREDVVLDDAGARAEFSLAQTLVFGLEAGAYQFRVRVESDDATLGIEEVQQSFGAGTFEVEGGFERTLTSDVSSVSVATGGTQSLALQAGVEYANRLYWLVGSMTGTTPGVVIDGVVLPLVPDAWFTTTLLEANSGPFGNTLGTLDSAGEAAATITVPAGLDPSLAGVRLHHAYAVIDPVTVDVVLGSNSRPLDLVP